MIPTRLALIAGIALCLLTVTLLIAADKPSSAAGVELELNWQKHWRNYARRCIKMGDSYYTCPLYTTTFPSSRGTTVQMLREKTSKEITEKFGANATVRKYLVRPNAEVEAAAKCLPELSPGHYGLIHSASVLDVVSADTMIIGEIWLVDAKEVDAERRADEDKMEKARVDSRQIEQAIEWMYEGRLAMSKKQRDRTFKAPVKLKGFPTQGLAKGDRWRGKDNKGITIAIVGEEEITTKSTRPSSTTRRTQTILVAVPAELFDRPITEEKDFLKLLETRTFNKELFTTLVLDEKKLNPVDERLADARIFEKLEGRDEKVEDTKAGKTKDKAPTTEKVKDKGR